eukprot:g2260.t1 g2260   contig11:1037378-1037807(-)
MARSIFSRLCCIFHPSGRMGNSVHFHAPTEDSIHVMIKHDKMMNRKKGLPEKGYTPRAPLSALLAKQGAIQATEDNDDTQILDAIASADCVASVTAQ